MIRQRDYYHFLQCICVLLANALDFCILVVLYVTGLNDCLTPLFYNLKYDCEINEQLEVKAVIFSIDWREENRRLNFYIFSSCCA